MASLLNVNKSDNERPNTGKTNANTNYMLEFNKALRDYRVNRSESVRAAIGRHLQYLSLTTDTSYFDPQDIVFCDFFANLYDAFTLFEQMPAMLWSCVNVLGAACKNQAAHYELTHTYHFVPCLIKMLDAGLAQEKKTKLLTVLQDLTCGMNTNLLIPHLRHLMGILLKWIMNQTESTNTVMLALGVIVNVCLNWQARYILASCIDIKTFCRHLLKISANKPQSALMVTAARMVIILDNLNGEVLRGSIAQLLDSTLRCINSAVNVRDHLGLRQLVLFYLNWKFRPEDVRHGFTPDTIPLINTLISVTKRQNLDASDAVCQECVGLVFRFLRALIAPEVPLVSDHYREITLVVLDWHECEAIAPDAMHLLQTVLSLWLKVGEGAQAKTILGLVRSHLLSLASKLHLVDASMGIARCEMYRNYFSVLKVFLANEKTRASLLEQLQGEQFELMFDCLVKLPTEFDPNAFGPAAVQMYLGALSVVRMAARCNRQWDAYLQRLLMLEPVQEIIAIGWTANECDSRIVAFEVICGDPELLPKGLGAKIEAQMSSPMLAASHSPSIEVALPDATVAACDLANLHYTREKLDEILATLRETAPTERLSLEVWEALDLCEHRQRLSDSSAHSVTAYAQATAVHIAKLQHDNARLNETLRCTRQMHLRSERQSSAFYGQLQVLGDEKKARTKLEREQVKLLEDLRQRNELIAKLEAKQTQLEEEKDNALKKVIPHLQDSLKKREKVIQRQEETIKGMQSELQALQLRLGGAEAKMRDTTLELQGRSEELEQALKDAEHYRTMMEQITKLAACMK